MGRIGLFLQNLAEIKNMGFIKWIKHLMTYNIVKKGRLVGTDEFGNKYYENSKEQYGRDRWVILAEGKRRYDPTQVPAEWHSWLHHVSNKSSEQMKQYVPCYKKQHYENLTGTDLSYKATNQVFNPRFKATKFKPADIWVPKHGVTTEIPDELKEK